MNGARRVKKPQKERRGRSATPLGESKPSETESVPIPSLEGSRSLVLPCVCENSFMDAEYGSSNRVHTMTRQQKPEKERTWRCVVCGKEKRR